MSRLLAVAILVLAMLMPSASAQGSDGVTPSALGSGSRISAADPLNGGLFLVNNHGMLFHPEISDIQEDVSYARWLGSGIIRVFATDTNGPLAWDGKRVGARI